MTLTFATFETANHDLFKNMKQILLILMTLGMLTLFSGCSSPEERAAEHIANGQALLAENELAKASVEFRNALQLNRNLPDAWYGMARIHESRQQWGKAFDLLVRIRNSHPRHMDARVLLAKLLLASDQIDEALMDAKDIVDLAPDDARSHAIMAAVQLKLGEFGKADRAIEQALKLDPTNQEAILARVGMLVTRKQYDEAMALLDSALRSNPDNKAYYLARLTIYGELGDDVAIGKTYEDLIHKFPEQNSYRQALVRHYLRVNDIDKAERLLIENVDRYPDRVEEKIRLIDFLTRHRSIDMAIARIKSYIDDDESEYALKFFLGEMYQFNGLVSDAIAVYNDIIEDEDLNPPGLKARVELARIEMQLGNLAASRVLIEEVLAKDKANEGAMLLQARFYLAERNYNEAVTNLRTVLRDNPSSVEAMTLLGRAHSALGQTDVAIESLSGAYERNPGQANLANPLAEILVGTGKLEQAETVLKESMEAGNDTVDALRLLTQVQVMQGKWKEAEELAQRLLTYDSEAALSQQMLGLVYQGQNRKEQSILAFKRAHDLDPEVPEPIMAVSQAYVRDGQFDKARSFLRAVAEDNPENTIPYQLLGQIDLYQGKIVQAIGNFEKIVELEPGLEIGHRSLAQVYIRENRLDEAKNTLQNGLSELPGNISLSLILARVFELQERFEDAIGLYERLLETNPDVIIARNNLASLLSDYRDDQASHDRARTVAADRRDSDVPQFRDTYAWASVRSGLFLEEAVSILKSLVRDHASVGVYHYHLGEGYRKKGSNYDARNHLRKAIELEGSDSVVAARAERSLKLISQ